MKHTLHNIAKEHNFISSLFESFGEENYDRYSLIREHNILFVTTWHVDKMVDDFKLITHNKEMNDYFKNIIELSKSSSMSEKGEWFHKDAVLNLMNIAYNQKYNGK